MLKFLTCRYVKFYFNFWPIFLIAIPIGIFVFNRPVCEDGSFLHVLIAWIMQVFALSGQSAYNNTWWFNSLIIAFYALFPIFFEVAKRYPIYTLIVAFLTVSIGVIPFYNLSIYTFVFVVGIVMALNGRIIDLVLNVIRRSVIKCLLTVGFALCFLALYILGEDAIYARGIKVFALITLLIVLINYLIIRKFSVITTILSFLGKHSANIYLIHTFLYYYWFMDLFYSLRNPFLIWVAVMGSSLICSIVIEKLKTIVGLYTLQNKLVAKINNITIELPHIPRKETDINHESVK